MTLGPCYQKASESNYLMSAERLPIKGQPEVGLHG